MADTDVDTNAVGLHTPSYADLPLHAQLNDCGAQVEQLLTEIHTLQAKQARISMTWALELRNQLYMTSDRLSELRIGPPRFAGRLANMATELDTWIQEHSTRESHGL